MIDNRSVAEVLAYAKSELGLTYDQIGSRFASMSAYGGAFPLRTLESVTADPPAAGADKIAHLRHLRSCIPHLSFSFDPPSGRIKYGFTPSQKEMVYMWERDGRPVQRSLSMAHPPDFVTKSAADKEAPLMLAQRVKVPEHFHIWWLPFLQLLETGRFHRMQKIQAQLHNGFDPTCFCVFVSHRWLTPTHPDPEGLQAASVAWQLVGHLLNAVWAGVARGRHVARKTSFGHRVIGPSSTELGESILANLLSPLQDVQFSLIVEEAERFADVDDLGVALGRSDHGLKQMRDRLEKTPMLKALLGQFRVWYDYSCMPQEPRTPEEESRFEMLLAQLGLIQTLGRTVVVLDGVEQYLSRGWCTYEVLLSNEYLSSTLDVLVGTEIRESDIDSHKTMLATVLEDLPHIVWRAVLDTEVFGIQSAAECMSRLGLFTTRPKDIDTVYGLISGLGTPHSVHYDDGEVITGFFPLPLQGDIAIVVAASGRLMKTPEFKTLTLQSKNAQAIVRVGLKGVLPYEEFNHSKSNSCPGAHIAVFGRCEGEAILYANWMRQHQKYVEDTLGVSIFSQSWTSSDVAPVGHFACGTLTIRGIAANVWIIVSTSANIEAGYTPRVLISTLQSACIEHVVFSIDEAVGNVHRFQLQDGKNHNQTKELLRLPVDHQALRTHEGGLFRDQMMERMGIRP